MVQTIAISGDAEACQCPVFRRLAVSAPSLCRGVSLVPCLALRYNQRIPDRL